MNRKQYIFVLALMIAGGLFGAILSSAIVTAQSNRAQQTTPSSPVGIQKWDYKVIEGTVESVNRSLESFGNQGYEIAGFEVIGGDPERLAGIYILLKRPKP